MEKLLIGAGGNIGNVGETFKRARTLIRASIGEILRISPEERTAAMDCAPGTPDFLNAVWEVQTTLSPEEVLDALQKIEVLCGRPAQHGHNTNRTLDLDILIFGDRRVTSERLIIPHPRMGERPFIAREIAQLTPYQGEE